MPMSDARIRTLIKGEEVVTYNPAVKEEVDKLPDWATEIQVKNADIRTIACDNKKCDKTVSFDLQDQAAIAALPDWLRTYRNVILGNNARFGYCSDVCEVEGVTTGDHNVPEPKQVQEATPADAQRAIANSKVVEAMKTKKTKKVTID